MLWGEENPPRGSTGPSSMAKREDGVAETKGAMGAVGLRGLETPPAQQRQMEASASAWRNPNIHFL